MLHVMPEPASSGIRSVDYDTEAAVGVCRQLVIALEYCHAKQVINRDLKPENTLIMTLDGQPYVKLCDFG